MKALIRRIASSFNSLAGERRSLRSSKAKPALSRGGGHSSVRYIRGILAATVLAAAASTSAYAENISNDQALYLSAPTLVQPSGGMTGLIAGTRYDDITVSLNAQRLDGNNTALSVYTAVYADESLICAAGGDFPVTNEETKISLEVPAFTAENERYSLRIFIWEDMCPCTDTLRVGVQAQTPSQEEQDMNTIRARIEADSNLYNKGTNPSSLCALLDGNGKFTDIDYSPTTQMSYWSPAAVFERANKMAQAYFSPGNRWYMDPSLKADIDSVLNDWAKNQYKSPNWWFNEIKVPQNLSKLLLYPFDESEPYLQTLRQLASLGLPKVNESLPHKASDTGGNLTDKLQTAIKIATATKDSNAMRNIVTYLLDNELSVFDHDGNGEGIMADYTLHQHGAFFYNGSYGSVFCGGVNKLLAYLEDTSFMVSPRALNTYADFILEGHSWFFKNNGSDFACFGRAISRNNAVGESIRKDSLGAAQILSRIPNVERRQDLLALIENRLSGSDCTTTAARYFYLSDMAVMHRPDFYVGVRTSSDRNRNTEYMNGENKKANYIGDGTTVFLKTGREYKNIFAVWDWNRIPGTTTEYIPGGPVMSGTYQKGTTEFVGGTTDGIHVISAMNYGRHGVTAKKSYFMIGDTMTALGADITGTTAGRQVNTTMNQCLQNGQITYYNGIQSSISDTPAFATSGVKWVHHDNTGYYFPDGESLTITAQSRSGRWADINSSQSAGTVTQRVFSLYKNHGVQPQGDSYSYTVLPSAQLSELQAYALSPDISILSNNAQVQAVWSRQEQTAGIVFWTQMAARAYSRSLTIPRNVTGLSEDLVIQALRDPCVVLLNKTADGFCLSVANPKNDSLAETYLSINRKLTGENASWDGEKTVVTVTFPQGNHRGDTVTIQLKDAE